MGGGCPRSKDRLHPDVLHLKSQESDISPSSRWVWLSTSMIHSPAVFKEDSQRINSRTWLQHNPFCWPPFLIAEITDVQYRFRGALWSWAPQSLVVWTLNGESPDIRALQLRRLPGKCVPGRVVRGLSCFIANGSTLEPRRWGTEWHSKEPWATYLGTAAPLSLLNKIHSLPLPAW